MVRIRFYFIDERIRLTITINTVEMAGIFHSNSSIFQTPIICLESAAAMHESKLPN